MGRGFVLKDCGQTKMFEITSFKETGLVEHGFSTRIGGVGKEPYDTLNLALHVGDEPADVIENRNRACELFDVDISRIVTCQQVHGTNIEAVTEGAAGLGAISYDEAFPDTDGIITNRPGLLLATFYADCVPLFILDPVKKVVGSIHAGWKGTVAGIGAVALERMTAEYGSNPADCLVGIGPSIGPCCYEVDGPVIDELHKFSWWQDVISELGRGLPHLNLWETNRRIMIDAGVQEKNIQIAGVCTCCSQDILFSYRGGQGVTGRMGAFIMLKGVPEGVGSNDG
ncbi:MAG TPA: peptidoglycan editing factor PgeF [Desulfobacteria bacterium]|nr:peptidoglycan editing factor PgeF [Desulfobacteria bacterium]